MNKILIATDLKPESENALIRAIQLVKDTGLKLHILYVAFIPTISGHENKTNDAEEVYRSQIRALIQKHTSWSDDKFYIHISRGGRVRGEIDNLARKLDVSLIVMGAGNRSADVPDFVRSKVEHVIWQGHYPVLAVYEKPIAPYKNILVVRRQSGFSGGLLGFWKRRKQEKFIDSVRKTLHSNILSPDQVTYKGVYEISATDILSEIQENNFDLLVLEVQYSGSLQPEIDDETRKILADTPCDLLLFRRS